MSLMYSPENVSNTGINGIGGSPIMMDGFTTSFQYSNTSTEHLLDRTESLNLATPSPLPDSPELDYEELPAPIGSNGMMDEVRVKVSCQRDHLNLRHARDN